MSLNRRNFLKNSAASLLGLGMGPGLVAQVLAQGCAAKDLPRASARRLVLIELEGANDALATLQPLNDGNLKRLRPTLYTPPEQLIHLSDTMGLHPAMSALEKLWQESKLGLISHVGFSPPDRSHFRALDIWHSGEPERPDVRDGWLGRALSAAKARKIAGPGLIHLAPGPTPLHFAGPDSTILHVESPDALDLPRPAYAPILAANEKRRGSASEAAFLAAETRAAMAISKRLKSEALPGLDSQGLKRQVAMAATLSRVLPEDLVFFCRLSGFDSHAAQRDSHPSLLRNLAESVAELEQFYRDHEAGEVLIVVYSEFGRRIKENASRGTDHGAGGLMLLTGSKLRGGFLGPALDLSQQDDGDLRVRLDFRTVYRALLDDFLQLPSASLGAPEDQKLQLF